MATDYEQFYRENRHGLGKPSKEFVHFFETYPGTGARVLDVGCGQGRDALFIARLGHLVTAVDLSSSGIQDLREDAARESLSIKAEVGDIRHFAWPGPFDVIVVDRTLHMLADENDRVGVLEGLIAQTGPGSHLLIADERSNFAAFIQAFAGSSFDWESTVDRGGFLFMHRNG